MSPIRGWGCDPATRLAARVGEGDRGALLCVLRGLTLHDSTETLGFGWSWSPCLVRFERCEEGEDLWILEPLLEYARYNVPRVSCPDL